jgi:Family of unknown function (DUF6481)
MKGYKEKSFTDRLNSAAKARDESLRFYRAQPGADDPGVIARKAARQALETARNARIAERNAAKLAAQALVAAEAARLKTEREAQAVVDAVQRAERDAALAVAQKAARDARYAARKARQ